MKVTRKLPWLLGAGGHACCSRSSRPAAAAMTTTVTQVTATRPQQPMRPRPRKRSRSASGLVTDIGGLNDRGFNSLANEGLERAASELGVEIRVLESKSDADYIPNLSTLAEEGYDLVISVGFLMGEATHAGRRGVPGHELRHHRLRVRRRGLRGDNPASSTTCRASLFKEQEAGYLAGYLAGLVTESNTISSVGGIKIPPVDRFIAGYQAGAKASNPDIKTLNGYSEDFVDQAKCKEVALDQIAKGSDVVFQVAGGCGLGALDAAQQEGVWGIGVDADQAFLGEHVLTSALKRVDEAVFQTISAVADGSFTGGGVTLFGLAEDGVGLGRGLAERAAGGDRRDARADRRRSSAGRSRSPTLWSNQKPTRGGRGPAPRRRSDD